MSEADAGPVALPLPDMAWVGPDGSLNFEWGDDPYFMLVLGCEDGNYLIETGSNYPGTGTYQRCSLDDGSDPFRELAKRLQETTND